MSIVETVKKQKGIQICLFALLMLVSHTSLKADQSVDLIRRLHLQQEPIDVIPISSTTFREGMASLFKIHSSLVNKAEWDQFLARNQTVEGINESLKIFNDLNGTNFTIKDTTTRFLFYDIRLVEIPDQIEAILKAGGTVELYVDASNSKEFKILSKKEMSSRGWNKEQKKKYLEQYDMNKDGKVNRADEKRINEMRFLGIEIFDRLYQIRQQFPSQFKLVQLPEMLVPEKGQLYPPIMHAKGTYIWITETGEPVAAAELNSNLTPNEKYGRLFPSIENEQNYLDGKKPRLLPQAEPYPQIGLQLGPEVDSIIRDIVGQDDVSLAKMIREGSFRSEQTSLPTTRRYIDSNNEYTDVRVHHSYGVREATAPWDVMTRFLSNKNNTIESLQSAQFVFSNKNLMQAISDSLRDKSNFNDPSVPEDEKVSIVINSDHGLQNWSALWRIFSSVPSTIYQDTQRLENGLLTQPEGPIIHPKRKLNLKSSLLNGFQIYWSKMQFNLPEERETANLEGNITPSKNHSKVMAVKYANQVNGEIRYRIFVTSANASQNAGVGTYEHAIEIDTSNEELFIAVRNHVSALRNHPRTINFSGTYLRLVLYGMFKNPEKIFQDIDNFEFKFPTEWDKKAITNFNAIYSSYNIGKVLRYFTELENMFPTSPMNISGKKFIRELEKLATVKKTFTDDEFYQLWRLSLLKDTSGKEAMRKIIYSQLGIKLKSSLRARTCVQALDIKRRK